MLYYAGPALKQLQAAFHQKVPQPQLSNFLGKGCATQGVRLTD